MNDCGGISNGLKQAIYAIKVVLFYLLNELTKNTFLSQATQIVRRANISAPIRETAKRLSIKLPKNMK